MASKLFCGCVYDLQSLLCYSPARPSPAVHRNQHVKQAMNEWSVFAALLVEHAMHVMTTR